MNYYFNKTITGTFENVVEKVKVELKKEGFGVLAEIDMKKTLKEKINVDFKNYKILEACNPPFAYKSLEAEDKIGIFLPCNIVVQQLAENQIEVAIVNPVSAMANVDNNEMKAIASDIQQKLINVKNNL